MKDLFKITFYKETLIGFVVLIILSCIYSIFSFLIKFEFALLVMFVFELIWIIFSLIYCLIFFSNLNLHKNCISEEFIFFLNGFFAGPFGFIMNSYMARNFKGYSHYVMSVLLFIHLVINILNLITIY